MTGGRDDSLCARFGVGELVAAPVHPVGSGRAREFGVAADEEKSALRRGQNAQPSREPGTSRIVIVPQDERRPRGQDAGDEFGTGAARVGQKRKGERRGRARRRIESARRRC